MDKEHKTIEPEYRQVDHDHMTIEEMRYRKKELRLTYADISEMSGVPLSTVQKILGGDTKTPRYNSMQAIERVLKPDALFSRFGSYREPFEPSGAVKEKMAEYGTYHYGTSARTLPPREYEDSYPLLPYKRQGEYTAEDRDLLPDDVRTELIDGVLYDMASPRLIHQIVVGELYAEFRRCAEQCGKDCYVFIAPSDVWLFKNKKTIVEPDLYIICDYSMLDKDDGFTKGAPPFILEVLSPSTKEKDMLLKAYKYKQAGVKEYWIVDADTEKVYVTDYAKNKDGTVRVEYDFNSEVPIGLSEGKCSIHFKAVKAALTRLGYT